MTVEELYLQMVQIRNGPMWERSRDANVVVLLDIPSMGPRASSPLKSASLGVDWEKNMFMFKAAESITRNT